MQILTQEIYAQNDTKVPSNLFLYLFFLSVNIIFPHRSQSVHPSFAKRLCYSLFSNPKMSIEWLFCKNANSLAVVDVD